MKNAKGLTKYRLIWSPTGQLICKVWAKDGQKAKHKAPMPYKKYLGEIYAVKE